MGLGAYRERCALVAVATLLLAAAFVAGGYFVPSFVHKTLASRLAENVIVDSYNSSGFALWQDTNAKGSPPMYMNFHVWNITNPDEWLAGAKPILIDIGPYSYRQSRVKLNVTFEQNGTLARYWLWKYFNYEPSNSINPDTGQPRDPCTDMIYSAYLAYAGVSQSIGSDWYSQLMFSTFASHTQSTPYRYHSVQELLWGETCNGSFLADPLLEFINTVQPGQPQLNTPIQLNVSTPEQAFQTGVNVQYTGTNNHSLIHEFLVWDGNATLDVWNSPEANLVRGTDGQAFGMGLTEDDVLVSWVDNIFRIAYLFVNKTQNPGYQYIKGVKCLWFVENITDYGPDPAYFGYGPAGVFNLSKAEADTPIFISKPHFLDADPYYSSLVEGMQPNRSLHDENLMIEPISGVAMQVQQRGQLNLFVSASLLYPNISAAYVPVSWLEQGGEVTDALADKFKGQVYGTLHVAAAVQWVGILGGFLLTLCGVSILLAVLAPDRQPLPEEERLVVDYAVSSALLVNDVRMRIEQN